MTVPRFLCRRRYVRYPGPWADAWRAGAAEVPAFESGLARYYGRPVRTAASARAALLAALPALGIVPGDEIVVPAYTFSGVVAALRGAGYGVVPADIEAQTFNLDPVAVAARIGPRTRAILATHLFGRPCALPALQQSAADRGLVLIEDAAQAMGGQLNGIPLGAFGDAAIVSFDLLKPVNSFGGGAVIVRQPVVAARLALPPCPPPRMQTLRRVSAALAEDAVLRIPLLARAVATLLAHRVSSAWIARRYRGFQTAVRPAGYGLAPLQAVVGRRLLASVDARAALRRERARALAARLGEVPAAAVHPGENGYFFVRTVAGDAAALRRDLLRAGIDAGIGTEVADFVGDDACPVAADVAGRAIQLPLYESLTDADLDRIAAVCRGHLDRRQ